MEVPEMQPFVLSLWICPLAPLAVLALPNTNLTDKVYKDLCFVLSKKIIAIHEVI